ncbi:beta-ketoacyl synthase N-terminal-like domain-containing protein [Rheinheimera sp. NSM]|uniref:beta-ketoacyl synthase N-terminal-like domain-containing protein n=1 Tax=Rheinheimera sp. NSM TaxID=3457884 RepID=UPI004036735A
MNRPQPRPVITGIGIVSAAGIGIEETWQSIRTKRPLATAVKVPGPAGAMTQFQAYMAPEYSISGMFETALSRVQLEKECLDYPRDLKHLIAAVGLALDDANVRSADVDFDEIGVVVADEHPGVEQLSRELYQGFSDAKSASLSDKVFELNSFLVPYRVARVFGLGGECFHVNSACTSGLNAMDCAASQIRNNRAPIAIAAGCDDPLSSGKFEWFAKRGLYELSGKLSACSSDASGTVFGDGGTALVFEDRDHAIARGARIYAEYLGAGFTQDGWRVSAPHPQKANQARAIRRALSAAFVDPEHVNVVIPHFTGIRSTNQYERRCLQDVWAKSTKAPYCLPLKPLFGHNLGGSSILEAAILAKIIDAQQLPHNVPQDTSQTDLLFAEICDWRSTEINVAVKASAAFAGFYGAIVLGRCNAKSYQRDIANKQESKG